MVALVFCTKWRANLSVSAELHGWQFSFQLVTFERLMPWFRKMASSDFPDRLFKTNTMKCDFWYHISVKSYLQRFQSTAELSCAYPDHSGVLFNISSLPTRISHITDAKVLRGHRLIICMRQSKKKVSVKVNKGKEKTIEKEESFSRLIFNRVSQPLKKKNHGGRRWCALQTSPFSTTLVKVASIKPFRAIAQHVTNI